MKPKRVESLPEPSSRRYDHAAIAEMLRAAPGDWHRIERGPVNRMQALAAKWRNARPAAFGAGVFDFRAITSKRGSGEAKLYARFVSE